MLSYVSLIRCIGVLRNTQPLGWGGQEVIILSGSIHRRKVISMALPPGMTLKDLRIGTMPHSAASHSVNLQQDGPRLLNVSSPLRFDVYVHHHSPTASRLHANDNCITCLSVVVYDNGLVYVACI